MHTFVVLLDNHSYNCVLQTGYKKGEKVLYKTFDERHTLFTATETFKSDKEFFVVVKD